MNPRKSVLLPAVALLLIIPAGAARADDKIIDDAWYVMQLAGQRLGTMHDVTRRLPGEDEGAPDIIQTTSTTKMTISRLGVELNMLSSTIYNETEDGVRSVKYQTFGDTGQLRMEGRVEDGELKVTIISPNRVEERSIPWGDDVLGPYGMMRLIEDKGLAEGDELEFKNFLPDMQRVANVTLEVGGMVETNVMGRRMNLRHVVMKNDLLRGIDTEALVDEKGAVYKARIPLLGGIQMARVDRETAQAEAEDIAELMLEFMVPSDRKIERPLEVSEALYRLKGPDSALAELALESDRQKIEARERGGVTVRVRSESTPPDRPATDEELAEYLAPTTYIQSNDERISAKAREVVGDSTGREAAHKLEQWVYENIEEKGLEMGFASASEVYTTREGDCTEHAVLLAAMCRAMRIPARAAYGLVYWDGRFAYHMWVEAHLDGAWRTLDATIPGSFTGATHIALGHSKLDISTLSDSSLLLVRVLGELNVEVLEYSHRE